MPLPKVWYNTQMEQEIIINTPPMLPSQTEEEVIRDVKSFVTENYIPPEKGYIDERILKTALEAGMSKSDAGRLAGSLAQSPITATNAFLKRNPEVLEYIIGKLEQRYKEILDEGLTLKKLEEEGYRNAAVALEMIGKQIALFRGEATEHVAVISKTDLSLLSEDELQRLLENKVRGTPKN